MARESGLRRLVLELLAPLHAVPIESPIEPGTPDVNCTHGWIELKHLEVWPKHEQTIVQPRHFEPEQRLWLKKRCAMGGRAWLLLRVHHDWCLVWGAHAATHLGVNWRRSDLVGPAPHVTTAHPNVLGKGPVLHWPNTPSSAELTRAIVLRDWLPSGTGG